MTLCQNCRHNLRRRPPFQAFPTRSHTHNLYILVGECSALWASGSDPADASADVSMHAGERATVYRDKRLK